MQVRDATIDDVAPIVAMLADDELGRHREDPANVEAYRLAFDAIRDDPNQLLAVLDDGGQVVGTLQLSVIPNLTFQGGWRGQVEGVRIASSRRGEGLGRVLLDWAVETARARGCRMVQLTTNRDRPAAHRFYEDLGFVASHVGMKLDLDQGPGDTEGLSREV
jgi:ribosomal protein S18 acetylase RimI-like enzyme